MMSLCRFWPPRTKFLPFAHPRVRGEPLHPEELDELLGLIACQPALFDVACVVRVERAIEVPHRPHILALHLDHLVHEPCELQRLVKGGRRTGRYAASTLLRAA